MKKYFFLLSFIILEFIYASNAYCTINVTIKDENITKNKILFLGFESSNFTLNNEAKQILNKILYNLKTTNLFEILTTNNNLDKNLLNPNATNNQNDKLNLPNYDININALPDFDKYSNTDIDNIVMAQFSYDKIGNLELRIRMWDIIDRKQNFGKFYSASQDNYTKTANLISDEIFKSITGESVGHFNSQIVYISETGTYRKRIKKISLIDFDGENYKNLTDGNEIVLTPVSAKKRDEIYYLRYFQGRPQIFSLNIKTLRSNKVGGFKGTSLAPNVNPKNSDRIMLSVIEDGNSDIHELDLNQNFAKKLTKSPAIDTTASYSPDGSSIVFVSDRDGSQQIYMMNLDNLNLKKISNSDGAYSKPMWSPDGKSIAFTKQKNGKFFIGVMNINGNAEKLLTSAYLAEGARWSPNGRYLIYSKKQALYGQNSIPKIFIIDIVTGYEHQIPTPENEGATDPEWL